MCVRVRVGVGVCVGVGCGCVGLWVRGCPDEWACVGAWVCGCGTCLCFQSLRFEV